MSGERSLAELFAQERERRAWAYFHQAYKLQHEAIRETDREAQRRTFRSAIAHYRRSLEFCPTAEAYTFLGWTFSFLGNLQEAIAACQKAIHLDPEFGNPYNDIGVYLIEQGSYDQAIPYLES
ncbi:MAG: tetratricopeptide repeat protein, partial [Cyanobacteria bacterium REEB65]|nr:tetratricopeptide repeat protein [Cyanobacteria bacterium REEB65]